MGNTSSTKQDRIEKASSTGVLTLSQLELSSWGDLCKACGKVENVRSLSLSSNNLHHAIPPEFLRLPLWSTLTMLDISGNNLHCACVLGYDPENRKHCSQEMGKERSDGSGTRRSRSPFAGTPITLTTPVSATRLEVLNISRNSLVQLPRGLCTRFPTLRKLICRGNRTPLPFPGGLVGVLGDSDVLNSVDLAECGLKTFIIAGETEPPREVGAAGTIDVYPNLEEVLLEGNSITGTFGLAKTSDARSDAAQYRFPKLKRVSVANPKRNDLLERVDPVLYTNAPMLNSLDMRGQLHEATIKENLSANPAYRQWQERHAAVINKQLSGAGTANLM